METSVMMPRIAQGEASFRGPVKLRSYLPWLDVLRFVACFLVIIQHSIPTAGGLLGHVGVAMFFSISGFLIGRILVGKPDLSSFYARRFLRIYPAYIFTLALFAGLSITPFLHHPEVVPLFWHNIVYYLTFTYQLSPQHAALPLIIVWSLCVEELFYLLLPQVFRLGNNRYVATALGAVIGVLLLPALYLLPDGSGTWYVFPINLFMGVLLALVEPAQMRSGLYLLVALSATAVMTLNGIHERFSNFGIISAVLCTATVWALATCPLPLPAVLNPFRRMGMVSYGIYLLHYFCVPVAMRLCGRMAGYPTLFHVSVIVVVTALSVFVASLMKRFIEDPPLTLRPLLKRLPGLQMAFATAQVSLIPLGVVYALLSRKIH